MYDFTTIKNLGASWENIIALSYSYIGHCALAYHKKWKLCFAFFDNDIMGDATCQDPEFFCRRWNTMAFWKILENYRLATLSPLCWITTKEKYNISPSVFLCLAMFETKSCLHLGRFISNENVFSLIQYSHILFSRYFYFVLPSDIFG